MAYGDAYREQVAKEIAEILRKSQLRAAERERERTSSRYNEGLHRAVMIVHAKWTETHDDEVKVLLEELEKEIQKAKVL